MQKTKQEIRSEIERLDRTIIKLAKQYIELPVSKRNMDEHIRILELQCDAIALQKTLKKLLK